MLLALLIAAEVPVLARDVLRGELLSASDFVLEERAGVTALLPPQAVLGHEATRRLPAGTVIRSADVAPPRLVKRGEPVTLLVQSGGLSISAQGRALADGRRGDLVRVVATATNRTLDGVVAAPGTVRIAVSQ